mmetsp:Transcript_37583/g.27710  ORF Transcript_37583/g.27710 Transcript_37583/m.27710 type:complete len:93 (+) Transcript_37583:199-477(+)
MQERELKRKDEKINTFKTYNSRLQEDIKGLKTKLQVPAPHVAQNPAPRAPNRTSPLDYLRAEEEKQMMMAMEMSLLENQNHYIEQDEEDMIP